MNRGRRTNRRSSGNQVPLVLSLTADAACVWPDYVSVSATVANADSVRFVLDGYTTQTVTAAQAAAGIQLLSDGTAPVAAQGNNATLTATPIRGSAEGLAATATVVSWKSGLEAWLGGYGVNHSGGEINTWAGQVAGTQATASANWPDRIASDPDFKGHDTVDFDGTETFACNGLALLLAGRASYTVIGVVRQLTSASTGYAVRSSTVNNNLNFYRTSGGAYVLLHFTAGSFVSSLGVPVTANVLAHVFDGAAAAPKARLLSNGVVVSGLEQGGTPFAATAPLCTTMTIGSGAVMRLAALFVFAEALTNVQIAAISPLLRARYIRDQG